MPNKALTCACNINFTERAALRQLFRNNRRGTNNGGASVAGRRLKDLPDDGSARTRLAQRMRLLKERAGDPTYVEIGKRTGYSRTALSGLFNGQTPSRELLQDVVQWLGGNPREWLALLDQVQREEGSQQESAPGPAEELERAREEIAALKLMIANPDDAGYWAERKLTAAIDQARSASDMERQASELLTQVQTQMRQLEDMRTSMEKNGDEMIRNAMTQATLSKERAQVVATGLIRDAENTAAHIVDRARAQAERIGADAQTYASSLHGRAGEQVDALLREADAVAADARRDADRLKARARIEIQRMVRDTQEALHRVGQPHIAQTLEQLLMDFAIGDIHPEDGPSGRHRRSALPASAPRPELTA
ncbi:helix-turn-helix domain-containing protein [Streptomyces sp. NPDC001584]|uniref:helix-turn-helix domain-containing protein n=1 Tax=Streptomyces sp. NPDC001584 TaxID=3154521 RepID=UPI00332B7480